MAPETNSKDWSTSYSTYLARSAALSARTLNLYQLALERISQGRLPPTIFQDHFPVFTMQHAAEFSNRLAEVGSKFLGNLVRLGSNVSPVPDAAGEREPVPPQFDASNPSRWYEQMAEYAGQMNSRAIKTYRAQLDRVAAGEVTPSEVQQSTAEKMAHAVPEYMQKLTQLYFELLNGLIDFRSTYEETYFQSLLSTAAGDDSEAAIRLMLSGPSGTTATASMSVANVTAQRTMIGHRIADVRRSDGAGPSFIPAIKFTPEALELDPEEEGTLSVSLHLTPEQYAADILYTGTMLLTGGTDVPLQVELRILATNVATKIPQAES